MTKRKKDLSRFLYHTKDHLALFTDKKNGWWGATTSTWNFGSTGPRWSKIADFEPIIARSASAVTLSEKSSINTNRKSTTRFPMSLRWSSYVAPKSSKGGLKNATRTISVKKIALRLKKVCYKATPYTWNFGRKWPLWSEIADFRYIFARSDSAVTPSEKSSININRKSTTRFPVSPRWTSYVVPKTPNGSLKMQSVRNLNKKLR